MNKEDNDFGEVLPHETRTVFTVGSKVINTILFWHITLIVETGKSYDEGESDFWKLFKIAWNDDTTSGDELAKIMIKDSWEAEECEESFPLLMYMAWVAISYTIQAWRAPHDGENDLSWAYICDAEYWVGAFKGAIIAERAFSGAVSENARRANYIRHKPNREMADKLHQFYQDKTGKNKSLDSLAEAATKKFPVAFRTARKHIGQAAKKDPLRAKRKSSK